jgi:hypothetical protein
MRERVEPIRAAACLFSFFLSRSISNRAYSRRFREFFGILTQTEHKKRSLDTLAIAIRRILGRAKG